MRHDRTALLLALAALALGPSAACESEHTYYDVEEDEAGADEADAAGETGDEDGETPDETADGEEDAPVDVGPPLSCSEVLTCLQGCGTDDACVTDCRSRVCPEHATMLETLMACVDANCATQCADRSSTDCLSCAASSCGADGMACNLATTCGT